MSKSALVNLGHFATGSLQKGCAEYLNEVEAFHEGRRWTRNILKTESVSEALHEFRCTWSTADVSVSDSQW